MAALHPSALRHILISIVNQLARTMPTGAIHLGAASTRAAVRINITAAPLSAAALGGFEPIAELLGSFDIATELDLHAGVLQITLSLLQVDRCVLAVDDNPDMAHLYRRYLAGTRYYLQHVNLAPRPWPPSTSITPTSSSST